MVLSQQVDLYCERLSPMFWSEPVNALTNAAFFIAAYFLFKLMRANKIADKQLCWLTIWIAIIGAGSFAFHTLATRGAMLLDVIPITIFIISYICVFLRMVFAYRVHQLFVPVLLFLLLGYLTSFVPEEFQFNGTINYAPAFIYLVGLAIILHQKHGVVLSRYLWAATLFFVCSMTLRSVDMAWCESNALGTHFLWHVFNGGVLYLAVVALLKLRMSMQS